MGQMQTRTLTHTAFPSPSLIHHRVLHVHVTHIAHIFKEDCSDQGTGFKHTWKRSNRSFIGLTSADYNGVPMNKLQLHYTVQVCHRGMVTITFNQSSLDCHCICSCNPLFLSSGYHVISKEETFPVVSSDCSAIIVAYTLENSHSLSFSCSL